MVLQEESGGCSAARRVKDVKLPKGGWLRQTKDTKVLLLGKGFDDASIASACKLTGYDVVCRADAVSYKLVERNRNGRGANA